MLRTLKQAYRASITLDYEQRKIAEFVKRGCFDHGRRGRILEVGCGYGRYLRQLSESGFDVTGVDVNPEIVRANREAGLRCLTAQEFSASQDDYDVVLMSHVIEHFAPHDLVPFMDGYLDHLKIGGVLVIATPFLTRFFYDDFDHVRPYNPSGLSMVFGDDRAQVQYYARNKLRLEDVWVRRSHWRVAHHHDRYVPLSTSRLLQVIEFGSALAFRLSAGVIGQTTGWVGAFRKVGTASTDESTKKA